MKKLLLFVVLLAVVAGLGWLFWATGQLDGLLSTPVREVKDDAARFPDGARATVHGRVVDRRSLPFSPKAFYRVDDETAGIWVQTTQELPAEGARVLVTGEVRRGTARAAGVHLEGTLLEQRTLRTR